MLFSVYVLWRRECKILHIEITKKDLDLYGHKGSLLPAMPYDSNILGSYDVSIDMLLRRPLD